MKTNLVNNNSNNQLDINPGNSSLVTIEQSAPVLIDNIKNHIKDCYNSGSLNLALTGDVTKLKLGEVYIVLELATRAVIGHAYTSQHMTTEQTNFKVIKDRAFLVYNQ